MRDGGHSWFIGTLPKVQDYVARFERLRFRQREFRDQVELEYLGRGPSATGGGGGWASDRSLCFRCVECDYLMPGDPDSYDTCFCGALHRDVDAGRFGSRLGDAEIEVYRARPINVSRMRFVTSDEGPDDAGGSAPREVVYVDPWVDLRGGGPDEDALRRRLEAELRNEVTPGHRLHHVSVWAEARSGSTDDVIFRLPDRRWAVVHLTWRPAEAPPWPRTTLFQAPEDLEAELPWHGG